jgi:hypothetical protein
MAKLKNLCCVILIVIERVIFLLGGLPEFPQQVGEVSVSQSFHPFTSPTHIISYHIISSSSSVMTLIGL